MKKQNQCIDESGKTMGCIFKLSLAPLFINSQHKHLFSGFSKKGFKKPSSGDLSKINLSSRQTYCIHPQNTETYKCESIQKKLKMNKFHLLDGILIFRKSQMKKIKFKQFYISQNQELEQSKQVKTDLSCLNAITQEDKGKKIFSITRTLTPRKNIRVDNNLQILNRKKKLPLKLKAKSYCNFPKDSKNDLLNQSEYQKCMLIKSKVHAIKRENQQNVVDENQDKQLCTARRRILRSEKINDLITLQQKERIALGDVSSKLNKFQINDHLQKDKKEKFQRNKIKRRMLKNNSQSGLEPKFQLNPWANSQNEEDKQNEYFFGY